MKKKREKLSVRMILYYQKKLSGKLPFTRCKYTPTCSEYGKEMFEKHNFFVAFWRTFKHIAMCNPFAKGGKYE